MTLLTVACVLWRPPSFGDFEGRDYRPEHVVRLYQQVKQHLSLPHRFVCFSNIPVPGIEVIPLKHEWPGWWSKLELFRPGAIVGDALYLDLDVTIVGSLNGLAKFPACFAAIKDWERPTYNSSVMTWNACDASNHAIYTKFDPALIGTIRGGDQEWISRTVNGRYLPRPWCRSYKHECLFSVPDNTKVVVFHGQPKPWNLKGRLIVGGIAVAA